MFQNIFLTKCRLKNTYSSHFVTKQTLVRNLKKTKRKNNLKSN